MASLRSQEEEEEGDKTLMVGWERRRKRKVETSGVSRCVRKQVQLVRFRVVVQSLQRSFIRSVCTCRP
jgi:hypothetical protein